MKRRVQLLKNHLLKKFPEVKVGFYLIPRSNFVHMGLDVDDDASIRRRGVRIAITYAHM